MAPYEQVRAIEVHHGVVAGNELVSASHRIRVGGVGAALVAIQDAVVVVVQVTVVKDAITVVVGGATVHTVIVAVAGHARNANVVDCKVVAAVTGDVEIAQAEADVRGAGTGQGDDRRKGFPYIHPGSG